MDSTAVSTMNNVSPLAGLTVVVTRPARQNDALVQQLRTLGANTAAIPLLAIEPLQVALQRQKIDTQLRELPDCQLVIFISQNAAEQCLQALAERDIKWPTHLQTFAIGSATTAFLAEHGIPAVSPQQMNSEGLLALLALQNVIGQRCIIFRGLGGRETLAQTLRERGAAVEYCELYRRELPAEALVQWTNWTDRLQNHPALICVNSIETLRHLQTIAPDATSRDNLTLIVPGERVTRTATAAGFIHIVTADDATDKAMLRAIILHAASTGTRHD
jgi:uroporphyrinogen-III synthase